MRGISKRDRAFPARIGLTMERGRRGADIQRGTPHCQAPVLEIFNLARPCDDMFERLCADIQSMSVLPRVHRVKVCRLWHFHVSVSVCRANLRAAVFGHMFGPSSFTCVSRAVASAALMCIESQLHHDTICLHGDGQRQNLPNEFRPRRSGLA